MMLAAVWSAAAQDAGPASDETIGTPSAEEPGVPLTGQSRNVRIGGPNAPSPQANATAPVEASPFEMTEFGDWTLECYRVPVRGIPCQVVHQVLTGDGSQVLLATSMAFNATNERTEVQMALPLGFAIQPGMEMRIGDAYQSRVPISRCTAQGCLVEGDAAPEMIAAMRAATAPGSVSVGLVNGNTFAVPLSLDGFADAHARMSEIARNQRDGG